MIQAIHLFLLQLHNWSPETWLFEMLSSTSWEGETSRAVTCPSGCLLHKKQVLLPSDIKLTDYFPHMLQHKIWVLTKARMVRQTRTLPCCSLDWTEAPAGLGSHRFVLVSAWPAASLQRESPWNSHGENGNRPQRFYKKEIMTETLLQSSGFHGKWKTIFCLDRR